MAHFLFYIHFTGRQFYRTFEERKRKRQQKRLGKQIPSMQRLNREHFSAQVATHCLKEVIMKMQIAHSLQ